MSGVSQFKLQGIDFLCINGKHIYAQDIIGNKSPIDNSKFIFHCELARRRRREAY